MEKVPKRHSFDLRQVRANISKSICNHCNLSRLGKGSKSSTKHMPQAQLLARLRDQIYLCGIFKLQLLPRGSPDLKLAKTVSQWPSTWRRMAKQPHLHQKDLGKGWNGQVCRRGQIWSIFRTNPKTRTTSLGYTKKANTWWISSFPCMID